MYLIEILHQTTTGPAQNRHAAELYLIEILHQTTTFDFRPRYSPGCILSKFYIKPQPSRCRRICVYRCILSKFYIKPQPSSLPRVLPRVVSYRNSTSNHNVAWRLCYVYWLYLIEILHQTTTPLSSPLPFCCCILSKFYIKPQQSAKTIRI